MGLDIANVFYLIASVFFIIGLKGLTHPRTAPKGNLYGALGMLVAVITALVSEVNLHWGYIIGGLAVGGFIGTLLALKIQMTAMPQLVALFNGFGGGASLFVAAAALTRWLGEGGESDSITLQLSIAAIVSSFVGVVTLLGSLVAFSKLQRIVRKTIIFKGQQILNGLLLAAILGCATVVVHNPSNLLWFWVMVGIAAVFGILLVSPIGGADMPVVIAALNSYSGVMILTRIMCKAMNRSFANVIMGKPMGGAGGPSEDEVYGGKVKSTSAEETAMVLESARRVVIVPGYGMAVSQAQFAVRDLANLLESRDIDVEFAIHPVAGRMPGHMNVLLAEADISYDKLKDMETVNPTFDEADVSLVIGANDVVNPDARTNINSPIAGMPILNVDKSKTVIVVKRSLSLGFAGIPNPLFAADNTVMLFEDGKKAVNDINASLKEQ
jgi:NAD(P) transhydrogenase subunit beta